MSQANPLIAAGSGTAAIQHFDWPLANSAEALIRKHLETFLARNAFARRFSDQMRDETGTDFFEWVDHLVLGPDQAGPLVREGYLHDPTVEAPCGQLAYQHPLASLPAVLIQDGIKENPSLVALRPESIGDFIAKNNLTTEPEGEPLSRYRQVLVAEENGRRLVAVERLAYRGFVTASRKEGELERIVRAKELWATRPRRFKSDMDGITAANLVLNRSLDLVGSDLSCVFCFEAERHYWETRNRAARIQKERQQRLGLGWGNHDHHTFRCSREHFVDLITFLMKLGFTKRERYYAGAEAGWGAQISEHPTTGIVVFADVDLMPHETAVDFSTQKLPPAPLLGTVGLWVGLHGESFLQAGMHHLEARFDFDSLRDQLKEQGINTMKPFSDFDFLRQAFTEGERWKVDPQRAQQLLSGSLISRAQFDEFVQHGAIGSHLENLQRHGGFKGFNQKSVSVIISATDPRKNVPKHERVDA